MHRISDRALATALLFIGLVFIGLFFISMPALSYPVGCVFVLGLLYLDIRDDWKHYKWRQQLSEWKLNGDR
jgi:hypothetical protein